MSGRGREADGGSGSTAGREALAADLATAGHILFDQGILDAFGHVSARHPERSDRFLLSRNLAPALIGADDILTLDLDGAVVGGTGRSYLERFIHAEIYRARPDVGAVVHSHAPAVLPFGLVPGAALCPVCHMGAFLFPKAPVHEIRERNGPDSDMLIRDAALGADLARALGDHAVVLMRGHGMTAVGTTVREAVFRAVYTEANARIQTAAMAMGAPVVLSEQEAAGADAANRQQTGRAWDLWEMQARLNPTVAAASRRRPDD